MKKLCFCLISCFIYFNLYSQIETITPIFEQIRNLDFVNSKSTLEKLKIFYAIKAKIETTNPFNDSAYILVLLKISKYEFKAHNNLTSSINSATIALSICKKLKGENFKELKVNCYYNLGFYFQKLMLYPKAISYYDTVTSLCKRNFIDTNYYQIASYYYKADVYFFLGDYQKVIEESGLGINLSLNYKDTSYYTYFLNRIAQALTYENKLHEASHTIQNAIIVSSKIKDQNELTNSYKILGYIYEKKQVFDSALFFFKLSLRLRDKSEDYQQSVNDYIDLGNFYLNNFKNYQEAIKCYQLAFMFANKIEYLIDKLLKLSLVNLNIGETNLLQKKYTNASKLFLQSFSNLDINLHNDIKESPLTIQLSKVSNKDLVIVLMNDKTNLLLQLYNTNHDKTFLAACIQSAIVTDSVITQIRHEQLGEQSKLYWRDKTRDFYTVALEACHLANRPDLAFYFMEKSRAVLLNDKLNELNAASYLSKSDEAKQENYQIKIVELEQKLSSLNDTSKDYELLQLQYLSVKNDFEQFIKFLEQKYPVYYQYKYADDVPSLQQLQSYLKQNSQSFVDYFSADTATYILSVTPLSSKLIKLPQKDFNKEKLVQLLQLCANKEALMNRYDSFALLSYSIYKSIFQPLQLAKGRIIICADDVVVPFDALCTDRTGQNFLLNDYIFSYVYSARFLLKPYNNPKATGNFLGFAPVSFAPYLSVQPLLNAADALKASAKSYSNEKLFTYQNATKNNFFTYCSSYSIVSVFSHARADTSENEPVLFMQDSLIHLSELQSLRNPATQLVLLSACQTNVGKNATGEGIYSLARGFATAGIPSISATLWKADEQAIYSISEKFNKYLSEGMTKDKALQKAKLDFIQSNSGSDKLLPFYWANMIIIGNANAIDLSTNNSNSYLLMIILVVVLILITALIIYFRRNRKLNFK